MEFTHGQIMELAGGDYGKVDILWLDGRMGAEDEPGGGEGVSYVSLPTGLYAHRARIYGWMSWLRK
ncbi:MAG: hypothetical protein U5L72_17420 [Bacteroidales bacterium]|nr:hypothetical protein [Bacteroidales bacterium]